jgi:predicted ATPase
MARSAKPSLLKAPFLKRIWMDAPTLQATDYPQSIPLFRDGFDFQLTQPITILVGENGSGKSTLLEAIAHHCGFNARGGNRNQGLDETADVAPLARALRFSWLPRVTDGFFMRAESLITFIDDIQAIIDDPDAMTSADKAWGAYGGKSLHERSHGEGFLALFNNRFGRRGVYILDEPEAALSPQRQLSLIKVLHDLAATGEAQIIVATHSPMLMFQPNADLVCIDGNALVRRPPEETEHYRLCARFLAHPDRFLATLLADDAGDAAGRD